MDKRTILITLAAVVSAGAAWAHHGWGSYDANKAFTISAPVETLAWADPHAHVMLKYQGATWEATLAPLFRMQARGITKDFFVYAFVAFSKLTGAEITDPYSPNGSFAGASSRAYGGVDQTGLLYQVEC